MSPAVFIQALYTVFVQRLSPIMTIVMHVLSIGIFIHVAKE